MDIESELVVKHLRENRRKKKLKKYGIIAGIIVLILLPIAIAGVKALGDVKYMKQQAVELKNQLKNSVTCIKGQDYDGANAAILKVDRVAENIQEKLNKPLWRLAKGVPIVGKEISSVDELIGMLGDASDSVIKPAITQMSEYPLSSLKVGDGFNAALLSSYITFAEDMEPKVVALADQLQNLSLSPTLMKLADKDGKLTGYQEQLTEIVAEYKEIKDYLPAFKTILGSGEDRFYLLPAQNSSEIRASGGFPGSIGFIQIQDGVLTVGDFASVYDVLPGESMTNDVEISDVERMLYGEWYSERPKDACFNPDFRRVGYIMAKGYEEQNGRAVDGVITMTPAMIQSVLDMFGEVTLSDGTVMNGENATKILQYDFYYKYFGKNSGYTRKQADLITNGLFAETAKVAMSQFTSGFDIKYLKDYVQIFNDGMADRTIMMWMADEAEEAVMIESGCSGAINTGEANAVAGVYFSTPDPSKMGWFLDMTPEVVDSTKNDDGTITYNVKVTFNNVIDQDSLNKGTGYILGTNGGSIEGYLYFFAPVDGTIGNFNASNGISIKAAEYDGVQLGYNHLILIAPNRPVEITYTVTTAAGVTDALTFSSTPTLQKYRE